MDWVSCRSVESLALYFRILRRLRLKVDGRYVAPVGLERRHLGDPELVVDLTPSALGLGLRFGSAGCRL